MKIKDIFDLSIGAGMGYVLAYTIVYTVVILSIGFIITLVLFQAYISKDIRKREAELQQKEELLKGHNEAPSGPKFGNFDYKQYGMKSNRICDENK